MRKPAKQYHVESWVTDLGWRKIPFTERSLEYCKGWCDCMDSMYPSAAHRVVCTEETRKYEVYNVQGRGEVHTN